MVLSSSELLFSSEGTGPNVGAGLLAKAAVQPTSTLPVMTSSLASQLLQKPNPVGAGLPAKAACQPTPTLPVMTSSLASQRLQKPNPVGAGLPAKAACQPTSMLPVMTSSLASQLLQKPNQCGSGLARESAGSANIDVACDDVFAGKPAPARGPVSTENNNSFEEDNAMQTQLLINGQLQNGEGPAQPVFNPALGSVLVEINELSLIHI